MQHLLVGSFSVTYRNQAKTLEGNMKIKYIITEQYLGVTLGQFKNSVVYKKLY